MAEYEKFTFDQGSDIALELELVDVNGNPKNLTNFSAAAQMKRNFNSDSADTTTFAAALSDPTGGILTLSLTNIQTSALKVGSYVYDVEISYVDSNGSTVIERVLEGKIRVNPNVTGVQMATQQTLVRKITIGTPIRRVTGAAAQTLEDLTDITITGLTDGDVLQYNAATGKWNNESEIDGGTF